MPIITLLTDYGIVDSYVAEVKGAILKIIPNVTIIDVSHDVGNYNIAEGAFHMARCVPYFPEFTIHIGVVDPGVGSSRKGIIIKTSKAYLVGPDNGLLAPAAERLGVEAVYEIKGHDLLPKKISDVFDGRDVFGPTGALLAKGVPPEEIGSKVEDYIKLPAYELNINDDSVEATVIHVDGFGNMVTSVTYEVLEKLGIGNYGKFKALVSGREFELPYVRRFSAVRKGELLLLVAGGGYMEFAVNQGNAHDLLGFGVGEKVTFKLIK